VLWISFRICSCINWKITIVSVSTWLYYMFQLPIVQDSVKSSVDHQRMQSSSNLSNNLIKSIYLKVEECSSSYREISDQNPSQLIPNQMSKTIQEKFSCSRHSVFTNPVFRFGREDEHSSGSPNHYLDTDCAWISALLRQNLILTRGQALGCFTTEIKS